LTAAGCLYTRQIGGEKGERFPLSYAPWASNPLPIMLSMLRSSLVSDGTNPITQHYRLVRLVGGAGQEMVWKIYEAFRIKDGKVRLRFPPASICK